MLGIPSPSNVGRYYWIILANELVQAVTERNVLLPDRGYIHMKLSIYSYYVFLLENEIIKSTPELKLEHSLVMNDYDNFFQWLRNE